MFQLAKRSLVVVAVALGAGVVRAQPVDLADKPMFSTVNVPGNLALALSVEFPTAVSVAHTDTTYTSAKTYLGYFDPNKCYRYQFSVLEPQRHFYPDGVATNRTCTGMWSGNFLNWATMQTIDPFRWALTGGYRVVDTPTTTILEKAWASGQGGTSNFPNRTVSGSGAGTVIAGATPFSGKTQFRMRIQGLGNKMRFTITGNVGDVNAVPTAYNPATAIVDGTIYEVSVRVKVCDPTPSAGGLESNCVAYGGNYKPEGLMQKYADRMRYSAFGYLNDGNLQRDGGVLRARQKFIGPMQPVPGGTPAANPIAEWDPVTGVYLTNPDAVDAAATTVQFGVPVANSGVINYLNKFGQIVPGTYKTYDPVGELYYAAIRYFKNQGNVPAWTQMSTASAATKAKWIDGFPVVTNWDDPIKYSCQKNFILGIGDVNTHADKNLPGPTPTANEPAKPAQVSADTTVDAVARTNRVGLLQGLSATLGLTNPYNGCCNNNAALMAGLAFDAHTKDIRPDLPNNVGGTGFQSISTYWLDILEYQTYKPNNQFYLAAKFGGFRVPDGFNPDTHSTPLDTSWWHSSGESVGSGASTQLRPDNYFVASRPDMMVDGLTQLFAKIEAERDESTTTAFATVGAKVTSTGTATYASSFNPQGWTGDVTGSIVTFDSLGNPTPVQKWSAKERLDNATAPSLRKIVTRCSTASAAVEFAAGMSCAGTFATVPGVTSTTAADVIDFLRGVRTKEGNPFRRRLSMLGDISGSKATPVGAPSMAFNDMSNPGYSAFKSAYASRKTVVYVGANDGMMHAFDGTVPAGAASCSSCGTELFAYIPSLVHPNLPLLASPNYTHRFYVDATPLAFDFDLSKTDGSTLTAPDWRTILVGGLGKGGKGYYALDVTDPSSWETVSDVSGIAKWEFTDPDLGFTYGDASVVKTKKYGWVVIFTSGYNNGNAQGRGFLFIVNPRTGTLLEKIPTPAGEGTVHLGHHALYVPDYSDFTVDAAYAVDLSGNVWRFDLTVESGPYPAPVKLAKLTDAQDVAQPVSTRPLIEVDRNSGKRYLVVGTGKLLADSDIGSTQKQSLYVIADGTRGFGEFYRENDLPSGVSFPITRSQLSAVTDVTVGLGSKPAEYMGYYVDFGPAQADAIAERVDVAMVANAGVIVVPVNRPTGEPCEPSGTGRVMALTLSAGKSVFVDGTTTVPYYAADGVVRDLAILSINGRARVYVGNDKGQMKKLDWNLTPAIDAKRLNWREVPTTN